jgi:hypothetical protein
MTLNYDVIPAIERAIKSIEREYQHCQGLILTEHDLKSLIYVRLRGLLQRWHPENNSGLYWHMRSQDHHILASPLHLEAPWYDENGKLTIRPDITILEPEHLSILHAYDGLSIPSKQFEFGGNAIILELKFVRNKGGITPHTFERIKADFHKIKSLRERRSDVHLLNTLYCFFVIFNKTDNRCPEFNQFLNHNARGEWYQYIYGTGRVSFDPHPL